jgi:hypothetical protein
MNDLPVVNMLHTKTDLGKPIQYLRFCNRPTSLLLDSALQIAAFRLDVHTYRRRTP